MTQEKTSCCTPSTGRDPLDPVVVSSTNSALTFETASIPGGTGLLGTNTPMIPIDEESPQRTRNVKPFRMMTTTVTNAMFKAFVEATDYVSEAERFGWSFVFHSDVPEAVGRTQAVQAAQWWRKVDGAYWRHIHGPEGDAEILPDHPAVHISWNDAVAFARWAGGRLPTEAEWEHAARGGLGNVAFPWGNEEPDDDQFQPCNIWQGQFPDRNSIKDGFHSTAPVKSFTPNGYGLYQMSGNVWEWTSEPFKLRSLSRRAKLHMKGLPGAKVIKGGSFLCHKSYCFRYRIAARTGTTPDSTTTHQGFRLVFDAAA